MLTIQNIKKYLKNVSKNHQTYEIKYSKKEQESINNFNITKNTEYIYYGNYKEIKKNELKKVLSTGGNNNIEDIIIIEKIIYKLMDKLSKGYKNEYLQLIVKLISSPPTHMPMWHRDGDNFLHSENLQTKFITTLTGPGTLYFDDKKEINELYEKLNNITTKSLDKLTPNKKNSNHEKIFKKFNNEFIKKCKKYKIHQLQNNEGLIFLVGNKAQGLIHSEPVITTKRIFISIVFGSKEDIILSKKYYDEHKHLFEVV